MELVTTVADARQLRRAEMGQGARAALVPTMGFLHEGHLALVRRARDLAERVWVSIFVNPTQFGPGEDFDRYPRDLERDLGLLDTEGVDAVFAPTVEEMYPRPPAVEIGFSGLDRGLCGAHRPGHFAGVGLVVSKLFNIIRPEIAVFGQKDAQQAILIRRLSEDLSFDVTIDVAPTVREPDGLAMSSRNTLLSDEMRRAAPHLHQGLVAGAGRVAAGERDPAAVVAAVRESIAHQPLLALEYVECVDVEDLRTPARIDGPVLLAVAAMAGSTRLIDNLMLEPATDGSNRT